MNFQDVTATKKIFNLRKRLRFVCGGTSASKTISILVWCIDRALAYPPANNGETELISVVSESFPHLRLGAMLDFENIMKSRGYWKDELWNKTTSTYTFETGSKIEFFSTDSGKAHGPRRDILFVNECNHVDYKIFDQLRVRTKKIIWGDWNPSNEFWYYNEIKDGFDHDFITLTYKDNEALDDNIVRDIESHKANKNWWAVYGLGQLGEVEGKIYKDWVIIDEIPHEARLERYGLDFGYSNDPAAIVAIYYYNGGYILDEITYQKGMSNKRLADVINNLNSALVVADSAEPKSIDELMEYGINILPANKGQGSVNQGIQYVQDQKISVTKRSINLIKEYRNYLWKTDKDGRILTIPEGGLDHLLDACFSPDTLVHTIYGKRRIEDLVGTSGYLYSRDGKVRKYSDVRKTRSDVEVVNIEFDDGNILSVTPDHKLLTPDNKWVDAYLLSTGDMIQSVTYGNDNYKQHKTILRWNKLLQMWKILFQQCFSDKKTSQGSMDISQRFNSDRTPSSSQRLKYREQSNRELRIINCTRSFKPSLFGTPKKRSISNENAGTLFDDKTNDKGMAQVSRWYRVAQATWRRIIQKERTSIKRVCSLPQTIHNYRLLRQFKILPPELQNESPTKTVKRITRGFCDKVYNLEVEGTHCLVANGVIAHNCRYGMESLRPKKQDIKVPQYQPQNFMVN